MGMSRRPRATKAGKPPFGTPINFKHSLAEGLVVDYLCNEGYGTRLHDGVGGFDLDWAGSTPPTWVGSKADEKSQESGGAVMGTSMGGVVLPGGANNIFKNAAASPYGLFDRINTRKAFSVEFWGWPDTRPTTFPTPISLGTLNTNGFIISMNTGATMTFRVGVNGAADSNDANFQPSDPQRRWQQAGGTFDASGAQMGSTIGIGAIIRDGLIRAFGGGVSTWTAPNVGFRIGDGSADINSWAGVVGLVRVWDRLLGPDEWWTLYHDPFALYDDSPRGSYVSFPASLGFGRIGIDVAPSASSLTTQITFAGAIPVNVAASGALTNSIQMAGAIPIDVSAAGDIKAAKKAEPLEDCGHPLFTKCGDSWLTKKVEGRSE